MKISKLKSPSWRTATAALARLQHIGLELQIYSFCIQKYAVLDTVKLLVVDQYTIQFWKLFWQRSYVSNLPFISSLKIYKCATNQDMPLLMILLYFKGTLSLNLIQPFGVGIFYNTLASLSVFTDQGLAPDLKVYIQKQNQGLLFLFAIDQWSLNFQTKYFSSRQMCTVLVAA